MRAKPILALVLAAGCGTTVSVTMINPPPRPLQARPPETVQLFTSGPPTRPHVDVAFLEAEQDSEFSAHRTREFFDHLRQRAAQLGCDAVVVGNRINRTTVSIDLETPANIGGMTATCIVYTEPDYAASLAETP